MACGACGNKARRPMRAPVAGQPVNQKPAKQRTDRSEKITGLRWTGK